VTDAEKVDAYIAKNGVTRCPDAILADTTACLSDEDIAVHIDRGADPVGDMWREKRKQIGKTGWALYWAKKKGRKKQNAAV
jgi:hypothetical protein